MRLLNRLLLLSAVILGTASEASAQLPSGPAIIPGIAVNPFKGGTVVTPSISGSVPAFGGTLQGTIQAPIIIPNGGSPMVAPSGQLQLVIPLSPKR